MMQCLLVIFHCCLITIIAYNSTHGCVPIRLQLIVDIFTSDNLLLVFANVCATQNGRRVSLRSSMPFELNLVQQALTDNVVPPVLVCLVV